MKRFLMVAVIVYWIFGCGGGGGGGSTPPPPPFNGSWQFTGNLAINDCKIANVDTALYTHPKVTQSGSSIVLISGTVTMSGETHPEFDGFDAKSAVQTSANGCYGISGYRFLNASSGTGTARMAMVFTCDNSKTWCTVRYDGSVNKFSTVATLTEDENGKEDAVGLVSEKMFKECAVSGGNVRPEKDVDIETVLGDTLEKEVKPK